MSLVLTRHKCWRNFTEFKASTRECLASSLRAKVSIPLSSGLLEVSSDDTDAGINEGMVKVSVDVATTIISCIDHGNWKAENVSHNALHFAIKALGHDSVAKPQGTENSKASPHALLERLDTRLTINTSSL